MQKEQERHGDLGDPKDLRDLGDPKDLRDLGDLGDLGVISVPPRGWGDQKAQKSQRAQRAL